MRVLKFGGTSVANADRFLRVADILENNAQQGQVATVLSAPAKITNHLVAMVEKTIAGQEILPNISDAEAIFTDLLTGLQQAQTGFDAGRLKQVVDAEFAQIKQVLHGISLLGQCPDSVNAAMICRGEKLSIAIMAELLKARGYGVTVINPVEKLLAHGGYLESTVDIAESTRRIAADPIPADHMVLMAGFTAGNDKGELVVLGRNGSDYSAAVLAACLRADCCEIWTDVDGVYTCDPRTVPDARLLKSMSYQEAMELSYFGAKVLHPRTISPIAQFQIPCLIKNTANPQAPGTLIGRESGSDGLPVKGITNLNNMAMINVSGPGMKGMVGMAARVFAVMSRSGISVVLITQSSSEYSISFCIPQGELDRAQRALNEEFYLELKDGLLEALDVTEHLAIISVVGDGMRTMRGISAKFFSALARANINIIAIAQGSSERSISVVVNNDSATTAVRVSHQMLFNTDQVIEVFVIGSGGVGGALLEQIHRQQSWLKNKHIDLRVCGIANSRALLTNVHGIDLARWQDELADAKEPFNLGRLIRLVNEYHLLNPVIVDCTSSQAVADQYADFLGNGFHVVTPNKKANTGSM
ncbi:MAG: bifunctional aspartate kinase/homoserine dehydrogenase I, partial [Enterobacterales bacterium]|nr:bifunctional aspartate kinase/homoserine dehydrogenase I [Enterobacterales bacterium]